LPHRGISREAVAFSGEAREGQCYVDGFNLYHRAPRDAYQLTDSNMPSQVTSEPDGRILISFMHQAPSPPR